MKLAHLTFTFLLSTSFLSNGQSTLSGPAEMSKTYMAAGLRFGPTSGITLKGFIGSGQALEGIFGFWHHGVTITGLYERYQPLFDTPSFHWYYGGGGHFAFESKNRLLTPSRIGRPYYGRGIGIGLDGVAGIEYKPQTLPIAFSLDLKPFFEVHTSGTVWGSIDPGVGIKVIF